MPVSQRIVRIGALVAFMGGALAGGVPTAQPGPPGQWTQITHTHNGARSNLGLARGKDGTLHVVWAGPGFRPYTAIFDTTISPGGVVARPKPVVSGWLATNTPSAVAFPDGTIHVIISGQKVNSNTDPYDGLNEAVGPAGWKLGPKAFGNYSLTVSSDADAHVAALKNGQVVTVWASAVTLLDQVGVDPATKPTDITPQGNPATNPVLAVDQKTGEAVIAYRGANTGADYLRRILPAPAAPQVLPHARLDGPTIAARAGGGIYTAYTPDGVKVWLMRFGSQPKPVPVPKGSRVLTASVAAGPDGRLWVFYGNEQTTWVTRTNKTVSGFEAVQALKSPPTTVQYFRLEGEGSAGPLDLFADVTVDGKSKDGSYHEQVWPVLALGVSQSIVKNKKHVTIGTRLTVRVTDAGDGVAAATVSGLRGGARKTDASGRVTVILPPTQNASLKLVAKKAGYVSAQGST